jgi:DNA-binding transcriptional MerR regulator
MLDKPADAGYEHLKRIIVFLASDIEMTVFTKKDMAKITGLTPRAINLYTEMGLIEPEIDNPKGRGTTRKYSKKNVVQVLLIKCLTKCYIPLDKIKTIIEIIEERGDMQKLDPESDWGWKKGNLQARIMIYDLWRDEPEVKIIGRDPRSLRFNNRKSLLLINIEDIFVKVDQL